MGIITANGEIQKAMMRTPRRCRIMFPSDQAG
jgi:hypothetical protein